MNHRSDDTKTNDNGAGPREVAPNDFARLGVGQVAYVKNVEVKGEAAFAVHGADGQPLVVAADRAVAFAMTRQNDLEPLSVH